MPLSDPAPREELHIRRIECRGFQRDDGLWDIEAHLVDSKTYGFDSAHRGRVEAGMPVHDMWLRLTIDEAFVIHQVDAALDSGPYNSCPAIVPSFRQLEGLSIGPGWNMKVRRILGGTRGCTHLLELLAPLATTAFQTLYARRREKSERQTGRPKIRAKSETGRRGKPGHIDTCHALASDGEVVKEFWPDFYTG